MVKVNRLCKLKRGESTPTRKASGSPTTTTQVSKESPSPSHPWLWYFQVVRRRRRMMDPPSRLMYPSPSPPSITPLWAKQGPSRNMKPPAANLCRRKKRRKRKEEAGRLPQKSGERCKDSGVEGIGRRRRGGGPPHQSSDVPHSIFNPGLDRTSEPPFSCDASVPSSVAWGEDERSQEKSSQTHKCN